MAQQAPPGWRRQSIADPAIQSMLHYEAEAEASGFESIAGVDEAGRGPLAGPIVAAAVVLMAPVSGVADSKQLTMEVRENLFQEITSGPHQVGIAIVDHHNIDRIGIQNANYMAMTRAAEAIQPIPQFLLVDGFSIRGCRIPHQGIVKGDQKSQSIAAASIVAKVTRDRIMREMHVKFPAYGFAEHKGYATRAHLSAIAEFGPCAIHRRSFSPFSVGSTQTEFTREDFQ